MSDRDSQSEVIRFLSDGASFMLPAGSVQCIQTHGAVVFLAGEDVYKIKRAVHYPYMDFSTLKKRETACRREFEINQPHAPEIYLGVVPITRESGNRLAVNGQGEVLEWAVHMRRFPEDALLADHARDGRLTAALADAVGRTVAAYHRRLTVQPSAGGAQRVDKVLAGLYSFFEQLPQAQPELGNECHELRQLLQAQFERVETLLDARATEGLVVRGHGDLHLANVAIVNEAPVLFDALEFDEDLATVDVLYDLAFLLMDLEQAGQRDKANIVLNRYLVDSAHAEHYTGLKALPLFTGIRAGVRSMVAFQAGGLQQGRVQAESISRGGQYLRFAIGALKPATARLVAIGGLSGSGKTAQARALAPHLGCSPGAVHLRSDQERKSLANIEETERLPDQAYTRQASQQVYASLFEKARCCVDAGHSVVLDATFLDAAQRLAAQHLAVSRSVPFTGIWLSASPEQLRARVTARRNDASDATEAVVQAQLARDIGSIDWVVVDSGDGRASTSAEVLRLLDL